MDYNLSLSEKDIEIILHALAQGPYVTVAPLINNIQQQASSQMRENQK